MGRVAEPRPVVKELAEQIQDVGLRAWAAEPRLRVKGMVWQDQGEGVGFGWRNHDLGLRGG